MLLEGKREKIQEWRGLFDGRDACWGARVGVTFVIYTLVLVVARMNIWYFMYGSAIMDAGH